MRFHESEHRIFIEDDTGLQFTCATSEFCALEPSYQPVSQGVRIWTDTGNCYRLVLGVQVADHYDATRLREYVSQLAFYQAEYVREYAYMRNGLIVGICSYATGWQDADMYLPISPEFVETHRGDLLTRWNIRINQFILTYFDQGTQQSFGAIFMDLLDKKSVTELSLQEQAIKTAIRAVKTWINTVMARYYQIKVALEIAQTLPDLLSISIDLENEYGKTGTIAAVPNVTLRQFIQA